MNKNLNKAKVEKNDEFYTQISDIEKELIHYKEHFKGKVIFCNCDDPKESNFWKFFSLKFKEYGLKKLVSTHFEREKPSYKLEIVADVNGDGVVDFKDMVKTPLMQNGDFASPECIEILKEADIVVTNPPFSLFREYVALLMKHNKQFLIIGNINAVAYKDTFKLIKDNKLWLGYTSPREFAQPNTSEMKNMGGLCRWYANFNPKQRHEFLDIYDKYYGHEEDYPTYDNYDAINVDKTKDIPCDYAGVMGVPITFLDKYNPEQFELLGIANSSRWIGYECFTIINGKKIYNRILIKNKHAYVMFTSSKLSW